MHDQQKITDWRGRIIGFIDLMPDGTKIVRDEYRRILGKYDKRYDVTRDFYGRIIAQGDQSGMLLNLPRNS